MSSSATDHADHTDHAGDAIDRRALRSVAVQFFANGAVYATVIPRLPEIRDRVDISIGALGVVLTLGSVAGLVGSLLTGRVIAWLGSRRVMIFGSILSIGSLPLIGFASSPAMLVVGLVGLLFFDVFIDVAMNVQGSALSARRHTPVMNRLHGLWSLGTVVGGLATVVLLRADVSTVLHLTTVAALLIGALMLVAPGLLRRDEVPELTSAVSSATASSSVRPSRFGVPAMLLAAGGATAMAMEITNGDWSSFRLADDLGASPGVAGLAFLAYTGGMTIGRLGGDWVQVRVGPAQLIRLAAVIAGAGTIVATLIPSVAAAIVGFLVAGLGTSTLFPQLYDRAAKQPGPPGSGFASFLIGQRGAAVLVPLAVGALANTSALSVGQAMAIAVLPSAVVIYLTTLIRGG